MSLRRLGISNYRLFWRRSVVTPGEGDGGRLLLAQFKDDTSAMLDLRALLAESSPQSRNSRLTDDQVVAGVASLIASGELLVVREWPMHGGSASQAMTGQSQAPPASSPAPGPKSQAPESATLPSNTDGAAQASTLAAAAASGAPFCAH